MVDEPSEGRPIGDGQIALEDHAVKTLDCKKTIKLVNLVTKRDSVFMAFSFRSGPIPTPFCTENAGFADPSRLRLCRVRIATPRSDVALLF